MDYEDVQADAKTFLTRINKGKKIDDQGEDGPFLLPRRDDDDDEDPAGSLTSLLPCAPLLRLPEQEPGAHELPADSNSMSLTCQLVPEPVTVTAYCVLPVVVPFALASR